MGVDREEGRESFLRRWSRVKTETREAAAEPPAPVPTPMAGPSKTLEDAPPELPPIENLTLESDFRGFFHPKVEEDVRRAALRKLFSDPHFNVMDGLDVYIDDYSKTEPIPAAMLASLRQAQRIFEWAAEKNDSAVDAERKPVETGSAAEPELASPLPALEEPHGDGAPTAIANAEGAAPVEGAPVVRPGTQ